MQITRSTSGGVNLFLFAESFVYTRDVLRNERNSDVVRNLVISIDGMSKQCIGGITFPMSVYNVKVKLIQLCCPSYLYRSNFRCFEVNNRVVIRDDRELPTHQVVAKFVRYCSFQCQHLKLHAIIARSIFLRGLPSATRVGNHTDVPVLLPL